MSQNRSRSYIGQAQGHRPAWVEIDVAQLRQNFKIINEDKPVNVQILTVVKDQAYGHGAAKVAKIAIESGCKYLAVATIDEALELRRQDVTVPILVFGERTDEERKLCLEYGLACFVNDKTQADYYSQLAASANKQTPVHVEVDTGLCRYGVHWTKAPSLIKHISGANNLFLEGIMSHFAMSDELDKSFALQQLRRFQEVLAKMNRLDLRVTFRHMCNTGGFLDLPQAHFDLVRIGILPLGVYPSQVCRRIPGLKPVMSVKTQIAAIRELETGDYVGYGMRYQAQSRRRIAVIPIGYGDGYPRVRNQGEVLIHGKRAAVIGGNAMDATMVDITDIPECRLWDEVVLMGRQDDDEIDAHEIAKLKNSVSYDVLAGWRWRLPRVYLTP
ncbi:alanine racemase [candidate division KSB1 bacterium]|nr:alanine racemase [candidate division KSB1 bacterium]NIR70708.1 alanine racemase [candidate division KSB1 bacterium]NIS27765.1 alanine racemase [candidate division KSB1 bacterium]NIT74612.1 alanine racemase [candidate division KSB1 bacterium]NIU28432.1 alanine racemase [candidate division KSB1 bacterium]